MNVNDTFRFLTIGPPEDVRRLADWGDIPGAVRLIDRRLAGNLPDAFRYSLTARREMLLRLPGDFPYTRGQALAIVREKIPGFTEAEFDALADAGQIRWIYLNGEPRYFDRFFASMCKSMPEFARRAGVALPGVESAGAGTAGAGLLDRCVEALKERGGLRCRIRVRASLRLKDEHFVPGMFLRAHLPIPIACEDQEDIAIEAVSPAGGTPSSETSPQRTVCWEGSFDENPEFTVTYSYIRSSRYREVYGQKGSACGRCQPGFFTGEEPPHIVFTPLVRALADRLAGDVWDPLEKARRFYDYITLNMKYTFMPAYFSLESIPDECIRSMTGDCGVFALLFLTLCRCAGIPARWQSGLTAEPGFCGAHDWTRFYAAPYGWLYADPSYGIAAVRAGSEARRRFYFGNLDPYRMAANSAFQAPFTAEKVHWRADPYDNQVGELETADRGLGYEEFVRSKEVLLCQEL